MLTTAERMSLKAEVRLMVREAGGQEACAAASDRIKRHQSFNDYGDPQKADRHMSLDTVAEIERFNKNPRITRRLAALAGYLLVPLPTVTACGTRLGRITAKALKETSDVFAGLGAALDDDKITAREAQELAIEIDEAMAKLAALKLQIEVEAAHGEGEE